MKKALLSLGLGMVLSFSSFAQKTIGGTITKDTTIATDIIVNSDLVINEGVHLTIMPGVTVQTVRYKNFTVKGSLIAKGTASKPIIFKKQEFAWEGIDIYPQTSITDSSIFEYCTFRDAGDSWNLYGGALSIINNNNVAFRHCLFTGNITDVFGGAIYMKNSNVRIDYCTITGNGQASNKYKSGGVGIAIFNSKPIITNTIITNNLSLKDGGTGVYTENSAATFFNCDISHNEGFIGVGIYTINSKDTLINCRIIGNNCRENSQGSGVGMYLNISNTYLKDCIIDSNVCNTNSTAIGTGLYIYGGNSQVIHCKIRANSGQMAGGVMCNSDSTFFDNCEISNNVASQNTGGIKLSRSSAHIFNTLISNNIAPNCAGINIGSYLSETPEDEFPIIKNCSIVNNNATQSGGGIWIQDDLNPVFDNIRFANNKPDNSNLGDIVSRDTSFSGKVSLKKSLYVGNSRTLTIAAGSIIEGADSALLFIKGRMIAKGTVSDSILFVNKGTRLPWQGIQFYGINHKNDSSYLSYCRVSGALKATGGALMIAGNIKIQPNHCVFSNSKSYDGGGGVLLSSYNSYLSQCRIINNSNEYRTPTSIASANAAGLYIYNSNTRLVDCEIANNFIPMKAQANNVQVGQGIYLYETNTVFERCKIVNNGQDLSVHKGGAFYSYKAKTTFINTLIAGNRAAEGAAFYTESSNTSFINSTIAGNLPNSYNPHSELFSVDNDTVSYFNSIQTHSLLSLPKTCIITAKNSVLYNDATYTNANGNLSVAPSFIDDYVSDYRITNWSPCINKGSATNAPTVDITGRIRTGLPDMGAYEWDGTTSPDPSIITSIQLNVHKLEIEPTKEFKLVTTISPRYATNKDFRYAVSNKKYYVSLYETGLVHANTLGSVTVYVISKADSTKRDSCQITVCYPLTSVSLNKHRYTIGIGNTSLIGVTLNPSSSSQTQMKYSSSNTTIMTVDSVGKITGIKAGVAKLYVQSVSKPSLKDSCTITVVVLNPTSVTFMYHTLNLNGGDTYKFTVDNIKPDSANVLVQYSVSNNNGTIGQNGLFTATGKGKVTVYVKSVGNPLIGDSCVITIKAVEPTSIKLDVHELTLEVGNSHQFTVTQTPSNANGDIQISVANISFNITINETGLITGTSPGKVKIYARSKTNYTVFDSCMVTIVNKTTENPIVDQRATIRIYPNPANDIVTVDAGGETIKQLALYSITGELLEKKDNSNTLNIGDKKKGMYFVNAKTDNHSFVEMIIKQ